CRRHQLRWQYVGGFHADGQRRRHRHDHHRHRAHPVHLRPAGHLNVHRGADRGQHAAGGYLGTHGRRNDNTEQHGAVQPVGHAASRSLADGGGVATATYTTTATQRIGGTHIITAVYAGDANYAGSTSADFTQTVNAAGTTTSVTQIVPMPSTFGESVTFTFT